MLDKKQFLSHYKFSEKELKEKGNLDWSELQAIHAAFLKCQTDVVDAGDFISNRLRKISGVHSLRLRVKEPEHLLEKICRKCLENPTRAINCNNYSQEITDLIGVRVLHLFKEDWRGIHDQIVTEWELVEPAKAYVRDGDAEGIFKDAGCEIEKHKAGYRSVHYLVKAQLLKNTYIAEVQVRTLFEEGWSEIDHLLRYPYDLDNAMLTSYLAIFNRIAGSADEMGSFIRELKSGIEKLSEENKKLIKNLNEVNSKLEDKSAEKRHLEEIIENLRKSSIPTTSPGFGLYSAAIRPSPFLGLHNIPSVVTNSQQAFGGKGIGFESALNQVYYPRCPSCGSQYLIPMHSGERCTTCFRTLP